MRTKAQSGPEGKISAQNGISPLPLLSGLVYQRTRSYILCTAVICTVSDGWSGKPSPLLHQILLLPACAAFFWTLSGLLFPRDRRLRPQSQSRRDVLTRWLTVLGSFETWSLAMIFAEGRHFASVGYHLPRVTALLLVVSVCSIWGLAAVRFSGAAVFLATVTTYGAGLFVAICDFPLNYLRSDMLPVIGWADGRWLRHLNPYSTIVVGDRLYDFPYLPGMLVSYAPFVAGHMDLRVGTGLYLLACGAMIFAAARPQFRTVTALAFGTFLLCPFLQYRHDLYLQAHWFALTAAIVLMQRRRFTGAAAAWGVSLAIYQLSWVLFPFVLLYALRRRGWIAALRTASISAGSALVVLAPFLTSAKQRIASNTVGQWDLLTHALADPINFSYWLTYVIRPSHLKWVQLAVLLGIFGYCMLRGRCRSLTDTLRWMACALAAFIPLNVLVDGYFYLTLLLVLLLYLCVANGWWGEPDAAATAPAL